MIKSRIIPELPVLVLEEEQEKSSLVITDLHIGFENELAINKIFLGKNTTTNDTINELLVLIQKTKAERIIMLGDVKSSIRRISKNEWKDIPLFFKEICKKVQEVIIIPGNHDSAIQKLIPDDVIMTGPTGMILGNDILLTHGHVMPSENFSQINKIIMGHIHPTFFQEGSVLNGQRVWISLKTLKQNIFPSKSGMLEITVIPSFNRYLHSTYKTKYKRSISPIIENVRKNILSARIITLDGQIIGNESIIDNVI